MTNNQIEIELRCKCKKCGYEWNVSKRVEQSRRPKKCPKCDNPRILIVYRSCKFKEEGKKNKNNQDVGKKYY